MGRVKKPKENEFCLKCSTKIPDSKRSDAKYCSERCKNAEEKARYVKRNPEYRERQRKLVNKIYHRNMHGHTEFRENPLSNKKDKYRHARALGYRSGLEVAVARSLEERGVAFEYETQKIKWVDHKVRTYVPDIILPNKIIVETKGRFVAADRRKHIEIKKQFPEYDIRFVFQYPNAKLNKGSKTTYAQWCQRHGFEYHFKDIPQEWLDEPTLEWRKLPCEEQ